MECSPEYGIKSNKRSLLNFKNRKHWIIMKILLQTSSEIESLKAFSKRKRVSSNKLFKF